MLHVVDASAPALMLAYGIGRIGCHLSGDGDWGIVNVNPKPNALSFLPDWMWSFTYPHNVINEGVKIANCAGQHCAVLPEPVYPTPLYEAIACILLFCFLWIIRKKITVPGVFFSIYLLLNGIERFLIEQIRVNTLYHIGGYGITQAQIISSVLILLGITGILYFNKKGKAVAHGIK
jgi:prolipoprotein diacylglyceryltransferase